MTINNKADLNITSEFDATLTVHLNGTTTTHNIVGVTCPMSRANRLVESFGIFVQVWDKEGGWTAGDRTGVCYEQTPGNLREILRASQSNYRLDRLPSLEWQDDVADKVATAIVEGADVREAVQSVVTAKHQEKKSSQLQLRWACQDGIARGVLSIRQSRNLFDFQVDSPGPVEASVSTPPPPPMNK